MAFDRGTNTSYVLGERGPCGPYESWRLAQSLPSENPNALGFGECRCVSMQRTCNELNQPLAKSVKDGRCYPVYGKVGKVVLFMQIFEI
jgi:hypothetical protein